VSVKDGSVFRVRGEEGDDLGFEREPGGEGDDACEGGGVGEASQVGNCAALVGFEETEKEWSSIEGESA
jgi:hypothetical protein